MATNAEIASRLGVSHSTVSRMRSGKRIGSPEVLVRISTEFDVPLERVMTAATAARRGKPKDWTKLMNEILTGKILDRVA